MNFIVNRQILPKILIIIGHPKIFIVRASWMNLSEMKFQEMKILHQMWRKIKKKGRFLHINFSLKKWRKIILTTLLIKPTLQTTINNNIFPILHRVKIQKWISVIMNVHCQKKKENLHTIVKIRIHKIQNKDLQAETVRDCEDMRTWKIGILRKMDAEIYWMSFSRMNFRSRVMGHQEWIDNLEGAKTHTIHKNLDQSKGKNREGSHRAILGVWVNLMRRALH